MARLSSLRLIKLCYVLTRKKLKKPSSTLLKSLPTSNMKQKKSNPNPSLKYKKVTLLKFSCSKAPKLTGTFSIIFKLLKCVRTWNTSWKEISSTQMLMKLCLPVQHTRLRRLSLISLKFIEMQLISQQMIKQSITKGQQQLTSSPFSCSKAARATLMCTRTYKKSKTN